MGGSPEAFWQDNLSLRHRHASYRRPEAGGTWQFRPGHHSLEGRIRSLCGACYRECAHREILHCLFWRYLSDQPAAVAGFRRGDHGPSVRIQLSEHGQRGIWWTERSPPARSVYEQDQAGWTHHLLHKLKGFSYFRAADCGMGKDSAGDARRRFQDVDDLPEDPVTAPTRQLTSSGSVPVALPVVSRVIFSTRASAWRRSSSHRRLRLSPRS